MDEVSNFSQFLLDYGCCGFLSDESTVGEFGKWLLENQSKVVLILDGFDQLSCLKLATRFKASLDRKQTSKQWVSAVLARKVLNECKVVLTSRTYALCSLDGDFAADDSFSLQGFRTDKDVESALHLYVEGGADRDRATRCFELIKEKRLLKLVASPINAFLLFQIVETGVDFGLENLTSAHLYNMVFNKIFHTKSYGHEKAIDHKMIELERTCFRLVCQRKFVIEEDDLSDDLNFDDLEELIPVEAKINNKAFYSFNRKKFVRISHQLGQVRLISFVKTRNSTLTCI